MAAAIVDSVPAEALSSSGIATKLELSKIGKGDDSTAGFFINIYMH